MEETNALSKVPYGSFMWSLIGWFILINRLEKVYSLYLNQKFFLKSSAKIIAVFDNDVFWFLQNTYNFVESLCSQLFFSCCLCRSSSNIGSFRPLLVRMQALQFTLGDKSLNLVTKDVPKVRNSKDVVVQVAYAGICGTDLHIMQVSTSIASLHFIFLWSNYVIRIMICVTTYIDRLISQIDYLLVTNF